MSWAPPQIRPGVRSPRHGGWYGLESYRVNERIAELTHHHFHDIAAILAQAIRPGQERLVVGGHADTIPQFLAMLPPDLRDRFAGSFVADTSTMTPARARALASPIIRNWVEKSEQPHDQVDGREDHSGMISPRKTPPATPDRVAEPRALLKDEQISTRIAFPSPTGSLSSPQGSGWSQLRM